MVQNKVTFISIKRYPKQQDSARGHRGSLLIVHVVEHFVVNLSDELPVPGRKENRPALGALPDVPMQRLPPFVRLGAGQAGVPL